jgi:peptidoglycan/xylan/chitin deacetylase (PgdA/CDA1 family)
VTRALPRVLEALAEAGLRATFFVEGLNTELYPGALGEIAAAGHEVAYHGWCHEEWGPLPRDEEAALLDRGVRSLEALGLRPVGFRPPGGELTAASAALLRERGFAYASPAVGAAATDARADPPPAGGGLPLVPFEWPLVDAFHYLPRFAARRGAEAPNPPAALARELDAALARPGPTVAVFHPFLTEPDERFAVLRRHLARVRELADRGELECTPLRELAPRVSSSPCSR